MKEQSQVLIRLSPSEKEGFKLAADRQGLSLTAWVRMTLRSAAIHDLQEAGMKIPFLSPITVQEKNNE